MTESYIYVFYFGSDSELFERMQKQYKLKVKNKLSFVKKDYTPSKLLEALLTENPCMVHIDFSNHDIHSTIVNEVVFSKRFGQIKSTLFTAILAEATDSRELSYLFASGFNLSYIKGADLDNFINDSLYFSLDNYATFTPFARANFNRINMEVSICSTLTKISDRRLCLETDISTEEDHLNLDLRLFKDCNATSFKIVTHETHSIFFPMFDTYLLELPLTDPWQPITEQTLQKETVENWIDVYKHHFTNSNCSAIVASKNIHLQGELYRKIDLKQINFWPYHINEIDLISKTMSSGLPEIIFWEFSTDNAPTIPDEMFNLSELIRNIKTIPHYLPILLLFNTSTKSSAMQKALSYRNVISMHGEMDTDFIIRASSVYLSKKSVPLDSDSPFNYFAVQDVNRSVGVKINIKLTSISEQEITFSCGHELPMFCVIHFSLPVSFFATVIPSLYSLPILKNEKSYMAHIHGACEKDVQIIRKFVTQAIYRPVEALNQEIVKNLIEHSAEKSAIKMPRPTMANENKKTIQRPNSMKRKKSIGKSKL